MLVRSKIKYLFEYRLKLFLGALFLLYAILHVYSWSKEPSDVDPINFTLALEHYDVSTDRPHPPGYPLYVALARQASHIVGLSHAYQLVNLLMTLAAALALFLVAQKKRICRNRFIIQYFTAYTSVNVSSYSCRRKLYF